MYLDFYGFREKPFNLTPDPRFVFLSKNHREAFAHLLYGINNRAGFIALTGEVGSGKTTLLRALLGQLDADHHRTALIFNPSPSPRRLLWHINREFGVSTSTVAGSGPLDALNQFLLRESEGGRTVVLVIDEAQNLKIPALEQVRLISNLETDREKLVQIVLAGQPEFGQLLEKKELRQLSQRITVRNHLQPMDFQDTVEYINHRLEVAGGKGKVHFTPWAVKKIFRYSRGLPRLINAACDRVLLAGYTKDTTRITYRIAAAGIRDLKKEKSSGPFKTRLVLIPALALLVLILAGVLYFAGNDRKGSLDAPEPAGAAEQRVKKYPILPPVDRSQAMAAELANMTESESARRAFNALAGPWKAEPVPEYPPGEPGKGMERAALERKLLLYRFTGNLGALLRMDSPAALQMTLPGVPGKRFISLVGREDGKLLVDPPIAGKRNLAFDELEKHWSGQAFLLWKDPLNLMPKLSTSAKGEPVKQLQDLLREAGAYNQPGTGMYDRDTRSAVRQFQASKGIEEDGIAGGQTLMLLYQSIDRFESPRLSSTGKK
jgi:general secretion pathway protein A